MALTDSERGKHKESECCIPLSVPGPGKISTSPCPSFSFSDARKRDHRLPSVEDDW